MTTSRTKALAGLGTALLCNFWVLEDALAERTDLGATWISDLAARTQDLGWRFAALEILAGLAVAGFALILLREARPGRLRQGCLALLVAGAFTALGGAAPLSCAEGLEASCHLDYDLLDLVHAGANLVEIGATAAAFLLIGTALLREGGPRFPARATIGLGAFWLALVAVTGLSYLVDGLDEVKGVFQRGEEVVFGAWLIVLGNMAFTPSGPRAGESERTNHD